MTEEVSRRVLLQRFAIGAVALSGFSIFDTSWLSVEHHQLRLKNWNGGRFRIALLADFHANSNEAAERAARACGLAMDENPDAIVLAGDFLNRGYPSYLEHVRTAIAPLGDAKCPVLAVAGNHDYHANALEHIREALQHVKAPLLINHSLDIGGVRFAGLDDADYGAPDYKFFASDKSSVPTVVVLHEPDYVDFVDHSAALTLSGHTHGGQICLPIGIPIMTPTGGSKYLSGFYGQLPVPLFVTRGVGTTGLPIRVFCRPEVSILDIASA